MTPSQRHDNWSENARFGAPVGAALVVLAVVFVTWPQAIVVTSKTSGHVDSLFGAWRLAWVADSVKAEKLELFDAPIFYPHESTFAYSDAILLSGLITAPFRWAGVAPFTVYNVYVLVALIASGLAAAALCYWVCRHWLGAALGGIVFTVSPHRMEHLDRIELLTSAGIPLAFLCWHVGVTRKSAAWFAAAPGWVAVQWYLGMYQALFLATVLPLLALDWLRLDRQTRATALKGVAVGSSIAVVLIAVYMRPYLHASHQQERSLDEVARYSARLVDFGTVHPRNWLHGALLGGTGDGERYLFPGVVALGLATAGLLAAPARIRVVYGAVLIVGFDLSLGTNGVLFPFLRDIALPYRNIRAPARAAILILLPLSVFASLGAALLSRRWKPGSAAIAAAGLIGVVAESRMTPNLWDTLDVAPANVWTAPADAVLLEYPLPRPDRLDANFDPHYMVARIGQWPRLLNGYSGHYPASYITLLMETSNFPDRAAIAAIRERGATHITVHERWLEGGYRAIVERILREAEDLEVVAVYREHGGEVAVFRVVN